MTLDEYEIIFKIWLIQIQFISKAKSEKKKKKITDQAAL